MPLDFVLHSTGHTLCSDTNCVSWISRNKPAYWDSSPFLFTMRALLLRPPVQCSRSARPTLRPHGLQHAGPPCPSPTLRVYSNSRPLSQWCHPAISSSVIPVSSHFQSFPASGSFQISQFFASGGQSTGVSPSASVLPMNIQDRFPLGWTGWISLQS